MQARRAVPSDTEAIAALTRTYRCRLAEWSPTFWRRGAGADGLHAAWLGHLVAAEGVVTRVVEHDGEVVACAVALPQPGGWFVDDVAVADADAWPPLLAAVEERPARACVPVADADRAEACRRAGLEWVSSYWIGPAAPPDPAEGSVEARDGGPVEALDGDSGWPAPPPNTFGAVAPGLALGDGAGGIVVGSRSLPAPLVYDPGGTVTLVERLTGGDRARLLAHARAAAAGRGDVLVAVVAAVDDPGLAEVLAAAGLDRTVDVYAWP